MCNVFRADVLNMPTYFGCKKHGILVNHSCDSSQFCHILPIVQTPGQEAKSLHEKFFIGIFLQLTISTYSDNFLSD